MFFSVLLRSFERFQPNFPVKRSLLFIDHVRSKRQNAPKIHWRGASQWNRCCLHWGEMPSFGKIGLRKLVPETQLKHFLHLLTCVEITSDNIFFGWLTYELFQLQQDVFRGSCFTMFRNFLHTQTHTHTHTMSRPMIFLKHLRTHLVLRFTIFCTICTHTPRYVARPSVALALTHTHTLTLDATLYGQVLDRTRGGLKSCPRTTLKHSRPNGWQDTNSTCKWTDMFRSGTQFWAKIPRMDPP